MELSPLLQQVILLQFQHRRLGSSTTAYLAAAPHLQVSLQCAPSKYLASSGTLDSPYCGGDPSPRPY